MQNPQLASSEVSLCPERDRKDDKVLSKSEQNLRPDLVDQTKPAHRVCLNHPEESLKRMQNG